MIGTSSLNLEEVVQDLTHQRLAQCSRDSSLGEGVVTRNGERGHSSNHKYKKCNGRNPKFNVY